MLRTVVMHDGRIAIAEQQPEFYGREPDIYADEMAMYYLKELLESPAPHRLGRCKNPACGLYFFRKRERKGYIKRGTYCGKCKLIGGAERTRLSRLRRKNQQLDAAAVAWGKFRRSNRHPNHVEWIARRVNRQFPRCHQIQSKWVTQNMKEILRRMGTRDCSPEPS
jgi:hypothetical protein